MSTDDEQSITLEERRRAFAKDTGEPLCECHQLVKCPTEWMNEKK